MREPLTQLLSRAVGVGFLPVRAFVAAFERRHQPEVDVHRLECLGVRTAGDVRKECAERGLDRRGREQFPAKLGGSEARREDANGGAFDIALAAGDLAGEADVRRRLQAELAVEQFGRADEAVAMKTAEACELGLFEAGDGAKQLDLRGVFELGLESDHVPQRAELVVLPELHDGVMPTPRARIVEPDRLLERADEWAARICANAPLSVQATKESVLRGLATTLDEAYAIEAELSKQIFATEDAKEGPRAFAEKRPPEWKGR